MFTKIFSVDHKSSARLFILLSAILCIYFTSTNAEEYSRDERNAIDAFSQLIDDVPLLGYQRKDSYLIKWLRAVPDMDIFDATDLLKVAQQWRQKEHMDGILNETISMSPGYVKSMNGLDIHGHPVLTLTMKHLDLQNFVRTGKADKFIRYNFQILEKMASRARIVSLVSGEDVSQIYVIVDFNGWNTRQHGCKDCWNLLLNWYLYALSYYPGLRFREVWINTPPSAAKYVNALRVAYSLANNEDLQIFDSDRKVWTEYLLRDIPSDQLTFQFGGSRSQNF